MTTADEIVGLIDRDELVEFALEICNIDSSVGFEAEVAEHLYGWMAREGFAPRKVGMLADRFNLLGRLPGTGGGYSLLFNGHMDTYSAREFDGVQLDPGRDELHKAWVEDDLLVGDGIVNDKGPVAAFLIAAKAIKASGHQLKGDLVLTAVVAETDHESVDETPGIEVGTKEMGARYLVTHGGIADYALVVEGTGFAPVWVEAGKAWFNVTLMSDGPALYTPYVPERTTPAKSPNMLVAAAAAIEALETWAADYQIRNTYECAGGIVIPKVNLGAIRGGDPTRPILSSQLCSLYLDVRTNPYQDPLQVRDEIRAVLDGIGLTHDVDLYSYRRGYEAKNIDRLADSVVRSYRAHFDRDPPPVSPPTSSMWRDANFFNEVGIPSMSFGPRSATHAVKRSLTIESLYEAACLYARIAVDICDQEKRAAPPR